MTQLESLLVAGIALVLSNGTTLLFYFLAKKDRDLEKKDREKCKDAFQLSLLQNFETFNQIVELTDQIEDKTAIEKSIAEIAGNKVQHNFNTHKKYFDEEPTRHSLQHIRMIWQERDNEVRNRNTPSSS